MPALNQTKKANVLGDVSFRGVVYRGGAGGSQHLEQRKQVHLLQPHNQGLHQLFLKGVLGPPPLARHTWGCPCFCVAPEAMHEASQGPLKGAMSAQKALQESEKATRELLEETTENSVSRPGLIDLPFRQINDFGPPNTWLLATLLLSLKMMSKWQNLTFSISKKFRIFSGSSPQSFTAANTGWSDIDTVKRTQTWRTSYSTHPAFCTQRLNEISKSCRPKG